MPPTLGGKSLVTRRWRFTVHRRCRVAAASETTGGGAQPACVLKRSVGTQAGPLEHAHGARLVGVDDHGVVGLALEQEADDAVVAGGGVAQRAAVAVDGEPALGLGAAMPCRCPGVSVTLEVGMTMTLSVGAKHAEGV